MGGGCRRTANMETVFAGGFCENSCFQRWGGCEASAEFEVVKTDAHCEIKPESPEILVKSAQQINADIYRIVTRGKLVFLYVPDLFSDTYFKCLFPHLVSRNGSTYISTNAGVRTLADKVQGNWPFVFDKGIREIWMGVESASLELRRLYGKKDFTNAEIVDLTKTGREAGINISWYLVDGPEDTDKTRLDTYQLIKEADPYRVHIGNLQKF